MALTTFSDLVQEARERVKRDALAAGLPDDGKPLRDGGTGATAYADAVAVYLGICRRARLADYNSSLCVVESDATTVSSQHVRPAGDSDGLGLCRSESVLQMQRATVWRASSGSRRLLRSLAQLGAGCSCASRCRKPVDLSSDKVVSTDPPYYDNIGYADLSDFFYVWLRRSLQASLP